MAGRLRARLQKHLGQRTVLGIAIPVIEAALADGSALGSFPGVAEKRIEERFKELASTFNGSAYHSTYLQRRLGSRGFLVENNGLYRLQPGLLEGCHREELGELLAQLLSSLKSDFERRQEMIVRLEATTALPESDVEGRREVVDRFLSELSGNRGETFEVISFAILREYFRALGFSLRRFSTTHANDGGMDFVAGEAIYQVSIIETPRKIEDDLKKLPGTKRVLVRPREVSDFFELTSRGVLAAIDARDLLDHFAAWLIARDSRSQTSMHMQNVINTAVEEFRRENNAESA